MGYLAPFGLNFNTWGIPRARPWCGTVAGRPALPPRAGRGQPSPRPSTSALHCACVFPPRPVSTCPLTGGGEDAEEARMRKEEEVRRRGRSGSSLLRVVSVG